MATKRIWSDQQRAFFDWFAKKTGESSNLIGRARAGTGKTTTMEASIDYADEQKIQVCAFNKRIAEEFNRRGTRAEVKTLHATGLKMVKTYWPDVTVNFDGPREESLVDAVCGNRAPAAIKKLIGKLHTKGREIVPHATRLGELEELMFRFELNPDEEWEDSGFGAEYVEAKALEAMVVAADKKPLKTGIDGSDMIFLPVRNQWLRKTHDMVIVDEAQDMTTAQLEIGVGICRGRMVVIGDDMQAIYAFRGADSNSLNRLKSELDAEELPLTVTYRCGKAIVALAQLFVPDFQAAESNSDGQVINMDSDQLFTAAGPGDFILSRLNAPLVNIAMTLLRAGKRTKVAGRDIGAGLISLVRKLRAPSVEEFLVRLKIWEDREVNRVLAKGGEERTVNNRIESIRDKALMLYDLSEGADTMDDVFNRIQSLFADDAQGDKGLIICSSVHKAKGLETDRVFVLKDTLRNHNQEEKNIEYVAITRAKDTLVWVHGIGGR
jgi:DNA helicase-2/ATP-dependent DNA helicase PcrA